MDITHKAQTIINKLENWLTENKLIINVNKTKYMIIKTKTKKFNENEINILYKNQTIEKVDQFKYLGVLIDNKLTWNKHKNKLYNKIRNFIPALYELKRYYAKEKILNIFQQNILSLVEYGIAMYGNNNIDKINKLLTIMLRIIVNDENEIKQFKNKFNVQRLYQMKWCKIIHKCIHNSNALPEYYKNLIKLKRNRNGLQIEMNYRKNNNSISYNKACDICNNLDKEIREIQDYNELMVKLESS